MKTYLDCLPCFLSQALKTGRIATTDEKTQREILDQVMEKLISLPLDASPPGIAQLVYGTVKTITSNEDPYAAIKKTQNELALSFYPEFKKMTQESEDPLLFAIKLAIAGNIIDLGVQREIKDIKKEILETLAAPVAVNNYAAFKNTAMNSGLILYLGDNTGEIVFDRILVEELKKMDAKRIVFAVRGKPIINDVTIEDAKFVGMDKIVEIIANGSDAPATILSDCSSTFIELFQKADMIIAKGQGNYESLSDEIKNIFFLLKAKCPIVADHLNVNVGDSILKEQSR
ncbi:MAG: DUF89 family protein [Proteobacteria bacterium]|nr:DUF89 family protein [Pseudomonadota bacterium]